MNLCFFPQEGEEGRKEKDNQTFLQPHWTNLWDSLLGYDSRILFLLGYEARSGSLSVGRRSNETQTLSSLT